MSFKQLLFLGVLCVLFAGFAVAGSYDINVSLLGPANGNWNATVSSLNFTFIPMWQDSISSCDLYTNATGTWALSSSNQTPMKNNTQNGIYNFTIPTNGTIIWNIKCWNSTTANYSGNATDMQNYTLNFDNSQPIITVLSPANNSYANRTTTYGGGIGNMTFLINVTGINATHGANLVNCSVKLNNTANHTNSTTTAYGVERIEYLQIPENSTTRFNVSCTTPAGVTAYNDSMYYRGIYYNPRIYNITTPYYNMSWVSTAYTTVNFSNNHTLTPTYQTDGGFLNCSLYLNSTYNQTNSSVYNNTGNTWFT
ncbi:MAG: hypothetical protein QW343_03760, partial [Candidatus Norongarragalinales archaeon]